jgi:putative SOS response-associated peptidase YedK
MPPPSSELGAPVTNIRNTTSSNWRMWLKPESRCLVPANSFAEYAPETNPETKKWFGSRSIEDRPLFAFAGIWTTLNSDRGRGERAHADADGGVAMVRALSADY